MILIHIPKKMIEDNFHSQGVASPYELDEAIERLRQARIDVECMLKR